MDTTKAAIVAAVTDTVYRACLYLDEGNWEEFLNLCDSSMLYSIKAYNMAFQFIYIYNE